MICLTSPGRLESAPGLRLNESFFGPRERARDTKDANLLKVAGDQQKGRVSVAEYSYRSGLLVLLPLAVAH